MADATDPRPVEPHVLDQPWRVWASVAIVGILLAGVLLGVLIIPVVQGRSAGLDAYTAICRALGILPGSPARQQTPDRTPSIPVSQVVWTPDVLGILARADVRRGRAKAEEVCVACHGETGVSIAPEFPHLAGQSGAAIYKQLHDYRTGSRTHPAMTDVAKALDEPIIADVAAYYAGQPQRNRVLGQSVVVENRPGAAGNIGAAALARATPDGYTFGVLLALPPDALIGENERGGCASRKVPPPAECVAAGMLVE